MCSTKVLLITANIASCFDHPKTMINPWLDELVKVIKEKDPSFIALHCQEVGGKNYEVSAENIELFLRNILSRAEDLSFKKSVIFIDENFSVAEKYTALGNIYFIKENINDVQIWDFIGKEFKEVKGHLRYVGDIDDIPIKEKSKFPQEFFPECKWSRKGFLRTRWSINGTVIDLVNIHLFHDASNFLAMEQFPSQYTLNRKQAMEHTLDRFHNDYFENVPFFIFGDFNFRLDTGGVVLNLTENCRAVDSIEGSSGEKTRKFYSLENNDFVLLISKKGFQHAEHSKTFLQMDGQSFRSFDKEPDAFQARLTEYPICFPPSYPFEEGGTEGRGSVDGGCYMPTRCPSWCDRVVLSLSAKELVEKSKSKVSYGMVGRNACMGDHKPIILSIEIPKNCGVINCCSPSNPCSNFVHQPSNLCFTSGNWCYCQAIPVGSKADEPLHTNLLKESSANTQNLPLGAKSVETHVCSCSKNEPSSSKVQKTSKAGDFLLKRLFRHQGAGKDTDPALKRVHSDPVKLKDYCNHLCDPCESTTSKHSNLVLSHSLDDRSNVKLRLRSPSSRLISHHSSSSEEWFEEVPFTDSRYGATSPLSQTIHDNNPVLVDEVFAPSNPASVELSNGGSRNHVSKTSCGEEEIEDHLLHPCKSFHQEDSLNNFLLADPSCRVMCMDETDEKSDNDGCKFDIKSVSEISASSILMRSNVDKTDNCIYPSCNISCGASHVTSSVPSERSYEDNKKDEVVSKTSCCQCTVS